MGDKKVTEKNIREFADLKDGYASGRFDYQNDTSPKLVAFDGELDKAPEGLTPFAGELDKQETSFKSGSAFHDTKELMPDLKGLWEQFKKEWDNRSNTPMTPEIAQRMMQDEKAAGSAVLDLVGGLPAMAAGGIHGVASAVANMDASKGLQTAGETMTALLPSTLMGNQEHQEKEGYRSAMAPVTAVMDTLNAAPQGIGEIVNAAGFPNAAGQITDAGKLGIMAVLGTKGAVSMYKGLTGKDATSVKEASDKLEALVKEQEVKAPVEEGAPMTAAHADDFAAVNPYDVGGHVTEAQAGRPSVIDNAQGDLLGGRTLEEAQPAPRVDDAISVMHQDLPLPENTYEKGTVGSRDAARAKAQDVAAEEAYRAERASHIQATKEAAHAEMAKLKETDFSRMEAQKELDFAESAGRIEESTARNFFTDHNNRDKAVRPEDSRARSFFLDHKNRDLVDHQFAKDVVGDRSMMSPEHTTSLVDSLTKGDMNGVLDTIGKNHESVAYRNLADYLKGKLDGINIKMHDEGIIRMGERDATGYYDPATRTVGLSKVGAVSPHTVLHEMVHAVTSDFINTRPNDLRVMGLKDLYNKLTSLGMEKEFPGIVNVKEFVTEAFSNPEFQSFLKEHRVGNRSTWGRFVDNVKSILGLSASTRDHVTNALEHAIDLGKQIIEANKPNGLDAFKDAGIPNKLADLMATRNKRPEPLNTKNAEDVQRLKIPALEGPISDFAFYDKPMAEIIEMAKQADDIPNTVLEKLSHQLQAGGLFESIKTRNPVVKQTFERITRASQEAARNVKEFLTDPETGLKARMRDLTPNEKGEIHAAMILHEGQRVMSSQELRQAGFTEKQVVYYNKSRELNDKFFNDINETRAKLGMAPMDKRIAHMAGRFMGDFSRFVFDETGKIVGRIAGSTNSSLRTNRFYDVSYGGDIKSVSKFIQEKHPEWSLGEIEYNTLGQGKNPADRFGGLMEAINFISKTDSNAAKLFESYREYMQKDAVNYLNATRHAKEKVVNAGGIVGSEGNKPWMDTVKNAEEGMKAQLAYYEQGYSWMAMERAVNDLKPLLGDGGVMKQMPRASKWAQAYLDHALGRNQGKLADAANWTVSKIGEFTGVGHSNMFKVSNQVKHYTMQKFMGLGSIPFSVTQLMQPLQVHPAMITLLKNRGLEFSAMDAQLKATTTYFNALTGERMGKLGAFDKQALEYAEQMGIMDVKMADHTKDINSNRLVEGYNTIADLNITIPERLTRGTSFLFYSHLLKDAGIPTKDIFGAAENLTNMTMVNYHPIERPMGYAKLGWLGDIASTLTRYKHNQISQLAFYTREGIRADHGMKSTAPLGAFLATSIAYGGVMGFFALQEADAVYQLFTEKVLKKPDTLTNVILSSNMPEVISHGMFSMLGLDMTSRFSNANTIPNSIPEALMPYGSAVWDIAASTGRFIADSTSPTKAKQFGKAVLPLSIQGKLENDWFTEKQKDGSNLYVNGTNGPNMGKGRVYRSEDDMNKRAWGFRNMRESKELAKNYSDSQINKANSNIVDGILTKVKYDAMDGTLDTAKLKRYADRAAKYGESPDAFVGKVVAWSEARKLSQAKQQQLQNALGGFKGAMNISEGR